LNVLLARVVLRPRSVADILDITAPYCLRGARILLPLTLALALPATLLCYQLHTRAGWSYQNVWILAALIGGLAEGPFTVAAGDLLFSKPIRGRTRHVLGLFLRRLPSFFMAHLVSRILLVLGGVALFIPLPWIAVRHLFVGEVVLLEHAGPLESLGRSGRFSRTHGTSCFGMWLSVLSIPLAFVLGAEVMGQSAFSFVLQFGEPVGNLFDQGGSAFALFGFFVSVPVIACARFLKYIDIRTRREGWDVQLRFVGIANAGAKVGAKP